MNANSFWLLIQQQQERDVILHPQGPLQMWDLSTTLKTTSSWSFRKLRTGRSPQLCQASAHGCWLCAVIPLATAKHMDSFVLIAQKKQRKNNIWKMLQQSYSQSVTAHAIMNKGSCKVTCETNFKLATIPPLGAGTSPCICAADSQSSTQEDKCTLYLKWQDTRHQAEPFQADRETQPSGMQHYRTF